MKIPTHVTKSRVNRAGDESATRTCYGSFMQLGSGLMQIHPFDSTPTTLHHSWSSQATCLQNGYVGHARLLSTAEHFATAASSHTGAADLFAGDLRRKMWLVAGSHNIAPPGGPGDPLRPDDCAHAGRHAAAAGLRGPAAPQTPRRHLAAAALCTCAPRWADP